MKILYFSSRVEPPIYDVQTMIHMFDKFAEVKHYGPYYPGWHHGAKPFDVAEVIKELYPNDYPDVVITPAIHGCGGATIFGAVKDSYQNATGCLRVIWIIDLHNDIMMPMVYDFLKNHGADLVLKTIDFHNETQYGERFKDLGIPEIWYPFSVDPGIFYDRRLPRIYDVANIGNLSWSYYPLRVKAHEVLSVQSRIRYVGPHVEFSEGYPEALCQSKMLITDGSTFRYPPQKIFEAMASNTLVLSPRPYGSDVIGLQDRVNYVEINSYNASPDDVDTRSFMEPIDYYLSHEEERLKIAQGGYELVHSRHTHDVRARETLRQLEKYL